MGSRRHFDKPSLRLIVPSFLPEANCQLSPFGQNLEAFGHCQGPSAGSSGFENFLSAIHDVLRGVSSVQDHFGMLDNELIIKRTVVG